MQPCPLPPLNISANFSTYYWPSDVSIPVLNCVMDLWWCDCDDNSHSRLNCCSFC